MAAACGQRPKPAKVENDLTKAERDALVVGGTVRGKPARGVMPLCRKLAGDHAKRVLADRGRRFDPDDLEGDALAAAVEAAKYYDPNRGAAFTSFVTQYVRRALLDATDERHKVPVRAWPTEGADGERFEAADRDMNDPDDLDHFDYLDADQRAAFDLIADGPQKDVLRLVIRGFTMHQIEQQTGMAGKDVRLCYRNVTDLLRRAGLVPADLDPYPEQADRQAAAWEAEKGRNRAKAQARADAAAERELMAELRRTDPAEWKRQRAAGEPDRQRRREEWRRRERFLDRLAVLLRLLLAVEPGATADEMAGQLGRPDWRRTIGGLITRRKLRPAVAAAPEGGA